METFTHFQRRAYEPFLQRSQGVNDITSQDCFFHIYFRPQVQFVAKSFLLVFKHGVGTCVAGSKQMANSVVVHVCLDMTPRSWRRLSCKATMTF